VGCARNEEKGMIEQWRALNRLSSRLPTPLRPTTQPSNRMPATASDPKHCFSQIQSIHRSVKQERETETETEREHGNESGCWQQAVHIFTCAITSRLNTSSASNRHACVLVMLGNLAPPLASAVVVATFVAPSSATFPMLVWW
jgi:aconitase A